MRGIEIEESGVERRVEQPLRPVLVAEGDPGRRLLGGDRHPIVEQALDQPRERRLAPDQIVGRAVDQLLHHRRARLGRALQLGHRGGGRELGPEVSRDRDHHRGERPVERTRETTA